MKKEPKLHFFKVSWKCSSVGKDKCVCTSNKLLVILFDRIILTCKEAGDVV